jgi:peptidyl-prolyl cis-trans isomerase A (cyclophilin A)
MKTALALLSSALLLSACQQPETQTPAAVQVPAVPLNPALLAPREGVETAPAKFVVRLATTKGDVVIEVTRAWSPNGADRFYNLVKRGYYDGIPFFRVMTGFMAQTGIHTDPRVSAAWQAVRIPDDPVTQSNTPGMVTYAKGDANSRTTHIFINVGDNARLDEMGFSPFGRVTSGMDTVKALFAGYGDEGVGQYRANVEGMDYFKQFPNLDWIKSAKLE